jgi:hypothetical protein
MKKRGKIKTGLWIFVVLLLFLVPTYVISDSLKSEDIRHSEDVDSQTFELRINKKIIEEVIREINDSEEEETTNETEIDINETNEDNSTEINITDPPEINDTIIEEEINKTEINVTAFVVSQFDITSSSYDVPTILDEKQNWIVAGGSVLGYNTLERNLKSMIMISGSMGTF